MSKLYQFFFIIFGYLFTFTIGSIFVRWVVFKLDHELDKIDKAVLTVGTVTGLCESFLIITLVLLDKFTALGLVIMAKSIVRVKKMEERPAYFLLGTLLNFCFSILVGVLLRIFVIKQM